MNLQILLSLTHAAAVLLYGVVLSMLNTLCFGSFIVYQKPKVCTSSSKAYTQQILLTSQLASQGETRAQILTLY